MIINSKMFVIVVLVICGVSARTTDRESYKGTSDKKYAGSMLAEIAKELVQRSTTSSQVTSLFKNQAYISFSYKLILFQ